MAQEMLNFLAKFQKFSDTTLKQKQNSIRRSVTRLWE